MTMLVSVVTTRWAALAADTLLTDSNGRYVNHKLVKATIVHCRDAKLIVGYCGLANIDGLRTDHWLVRLLADARSWTQSSSDVVAILKTGLDERLPANANLGRYGLTITLAGIGYDPEAKHRGVLAQVTNMERLVTPASGPQYFENVAPMGRPFEHFSREVHGDDWSIGFHGAGSARHESITRAYRKRVIRELRHVRSSDDAAKFVEHLVRMIRMAGGDRQIGHLVGHDCTGTLIYEDFMSASAFYTASGAELRLPNIVSEALCAVDRTVGPPS